MNNKQKILLVGPLLPVLGGMNVALHNLAASDLKDRYELTVLDVTGYRTKGKKAFFGLNIFYQLYLLFKLIYILVSKNPKIVHVQMASYFYFYRRSADIIICKLFGKKVIFHLRGGYFIDFYTKSSPPAKWMIRSVMRLSDRVIALSGYWKDFLSSIIEPGKITVVPNGVKLSDFHLKSNKKIEMGLPENCVSVIFIGAIGKRKGAFDMLDVIPKVSDRIQNVTFVFCGTGEYLGEIEKFRKMIKKEKNYPNMKYFEKIYGQELRDHYLSSDIFILPSYAENLPNSLLEAMAAGLPVVVSDVGAIPEVVKDGVNGFIIKAGDIDSIVEKVTILAQNSELRKTMGLRNIELVREKYDMPIIADKIGKIYEELLH
jgi:glycosyltransferase involved in cell wall biosynthesis